MAWRKQLFSFFLSFQSFSHQDGGKSFLFPSTIPCSECKDGFPGFQDTQRETDMQIGVRTGPRWTAPTSSYTSAEQLRGKVSVIPCPSTLLHSNLHGCSFGQVLKPQELCFWGVRRGCRIKKECPKTLYTFHTPIYQEIFLNQHIWYLKPTVSQTFAGRKIWKEILLILITWILKALHHSFLWASGWILRNSDYFQSLWKQ